MDNQLELKRFFVNTVLNRISTPDLNFIQVMLGPRQVGKTTALDQIVAKWPGPKIYETADGSYDRRPEWLDFVWNRAREQKGNCLLAIDEIQKIPHWNERVKILYDRDRSKKLLKVVLTGSASLSLMRGLGDSLAGRYEIVECPPWNFAECKQAFGWDFSTYFKFGGYPAAAALVHDTRRWQQFMLQSIIEPVISQDLQSLIQIQKPALLRQLFAIAMQHPAQEISYQKLLGQLQDRGNVATIKHYLEVLSSGFLITTLEKYSGSKVVQKGSSPKLIPACPALIHAFVNPELIESDSDWYGRVFEAMIGTHLARLGFELYYWRDGKFEVDYVLVAGKDVYGIEVKSGRRAKTSGFAEFKKKHPKAKLILLDQAKGLKFMSEMPSLDLLKQFV